MEYMVRESPFFPTLDSQFHAVVLSMGDSVPYSNLLLIKYIVPQRMALHHVRVFSELMLYLPLESHSAVLYG